jgi:hypothetical protein
VSPRHGVVAQGRAAPTIQRILDAGADPAQIDASGATVVHLALNKNRKDLAWVLLKTWKMRKGFAYGTGPPDFVGLRSPQLGIIAFLSIIVGVFKDAALGLAGERPSWAGTNWKGSAGQGPAISHETDTRPQGFSYVYKYQIAPQVE